MPLQDYAHNDRDGRHGIDLAPGDWIGGPLAQETERKAEDDANGGDGAVAKVRIDALVCVLALRSSDMWQNDLEKWNKPAALVCVSQADAVPFVCR